MKAKQKIKENISVRSYQRTLKGPVSFSGVGLHSGEEVTVALHPASIDSGIIFERTDIKGEHSIVRASWDNVVDTQLCSKIGNRFGVTVSTVEHLMAALAGCGVDNALIKIDGLEVPIMDGSAAPFVALIGQAGVVELKAQRKVIRILKSVEVKCGDAHAILEPADECLLDVKIDFEGTVVSDQGLKMGLVNGVFCKELAKARTFGFLDEVEAMRAAGLVKGGSLDNAIIVDGVDILNEEGLRFEDEFVRHKMLDALGDLYLAGALIIGRFSGWKCGHSINNKLLRALFADTQAWCYDFLNDYEVQNSVDGGIWAEASSIS